ncbi:MAG: hypothetical protein IKU17_02220 [Clostridia bacterium]|nr:hypothetical protein [Clostridia bacterium]
MDKILELWKEKLFSTGQKKLLYVAVCLAFCGLLLVLMAGIGQGEEDLPPKQEGETPQIAVEALLEQRLQPVVAAITGGENDHILVTLAGDAQRVYAVEETADAENNYVIVKNADGSQSALQLTEICPEIRGVVVVTPRAEDARIRERIVTAVTVAFGIPSSRVCVVLSN